MKQALLHLMWSLVLSLLAACTCPPGTANCDGECTVLTESAEHCGACGERCLGGALCIDGECVGGAPRGARTCSDDSACLNSSYCDGVERCIGGHCRTTGVIECDDGVACTRERCDEASRQCVSTPSDTLCPDGQRCTALDGASSTGCE
ncbi:MAG: hypothetical protein JJ863_22555 [Deltaproteobacteria bacterium]|nr:hypothetical protein [Deltaproteobacteria bacterium]